LIAGRTVNQLDECVRTAQAMPNAHSGIPRIFLKIKEIREPHHSPQRREKTAVNALAALKTKPVTRGIKNLYIGSN
jgi:hypothetical protein